MLDVKNMSLIELQKELYNVAKEKGWHEEGNEKSHKECVILTVSELCEALEHYRDGRELNEIFYSPEKPDKPDGISIELADAKIRILDTMQQLGMTAQDHIDYKCSVDYEDMFGEHESFPDCLLTVISELTCAPVEQFTKENLVLGLCYLEGLCKKFGIDIDQALSIKHEFNKTRPYRHGNKVV